MMRKRSRSPPPRHSRGKYSPSYRRPPDTRRDHRYSPSHGSRDRHSHRDHGFSSSSYSEMERSRRGTGVAGESRDRRDYDRDLEREGCRRLYDEDLGRRNTTSMNFQQNPLLGNEYPCDPRRMVEDRDRQSLKGLPPRDSPYEMPQRKHDLGESERIINNSVYGAKDALEYGGSSASFKGNNSERNYQESRFEELGSSRMMVEKPIYPKTDLTFPPYTLQNGGGGYSPLKKLSGGLHENEEIRLHEDLSREKLYKDRHQYYSREGEAPRFYSETEKTQFYTREEENRRLDSREEKPYLLYRERESQLYLKDTLQHEVPSSQYKASTADPLGTSVNNLRGSYENSLQVGSDGYNRSSGYLTGSLPTEISKPYLEDATTYRKDKLNPNMGTQIDHRYSTSWRSDYTEMIPLSDKPYGKLSDAKDDFHDIDRLGSKTMDPIFDGSSSSRRDHLTEARFWDGRRSPVRRLVSKHPDAPRSSYTIGNSVEGLGHRKVDLVYEGDVYRSSENRRSSREDYGYRQDEGLQPHDERRKSYMRDQVYRNEDYGYGRDEGLQAHDERRNSYPREDYGYGRDTSFQEEKATSYVSKDYDRVYDRVDQVFDGGYNYPLEVARPENVGMHRQRKDVSKRRRDISERLSINRNFFTKAYNNRPNKSLLGSSRYRNPGVHAGKFKAFASRGRLVGKARASNPGVRDIKKRLGPLRPVEHNAEKNHKNRKVLRKNEDDGEGSVQAEEEGLKEHGVEAAKFEPPEKSEEFKQMVRSAFFKFVKLLNENTVELKKLKEQENAGSFKCWVCGSDSEDFSDTESLVKHGCTESRIGYKAQHLGFHKALCALIGWKAAEISNNEWVREALSVADVRSLKEDLILWPPLVVVHNSSIVKNNPAGQVPVSVEGLQTMIQDMGFGEKTKVCRGKPVNKSILVVKFSATYSGFLEAERLHKFFADNKHGRTEFQKTQSMAPLDRDDKEKISSAENMKDVLYGFLGIGRDLNKLDSETKKRCVVRSKKEIQDLGDAPLKAE